MLKSFNGDYRNELFIVPKPKRTRTYRPVYHEDFYHEVQNQIKNYGLDLQSERYSVNKAGTQVIAHYDFYSDDKDLGMKCAIRNSYDKSMSFAAVCGSTVFICSNGMVSGDFMFKHKHSGDLDMNYSEQIKYCFSNMVEQHKMHLELREFLKEIHVTKEQVYPIVGEAFMNEDIFNSEQMHTFRKELLKSKETHTIDSDEFSAWDLYNVGTKSIRDEHPLHYIGDHIKWHDFMKSVFAEEEKVLL